MKKKGSCDATLSCYGLQQNCFSFISLFLHPSGWRLRKQFFLIKPTDPTKKDVRNILTWVKIFAGFYCNCQK